MSIRFKIILGLIVIIITSFLILFLFTSSYVNKIYLREAQSRVRADLNSAEDLYQENIDNIVKILSALANKHISTSVQSPSPSVEDLLKIYNSPDMKNCFDILIYTDVKGKVIYRANNFTTGDNISNNPMIQKAIHDWVTVKGTIVLDEVQLKNEGNDLLKRCYIKINKTPNSRDTVRVSEDRGMFIAAAVPLTLKKDNKKTGILFAATLINNNIYLADQIKTKLFQDNKYMGKDIGAASVTLNDVRISTTVSNKDNTKSVGSQLSEKVYKQVLRKGKPWSYRSFVVNDWYITAYEPLKDPNGKIIGTVGIGLLEEPFRHPKRIIIIYFAVALAITAIASLILLFFITKMLMKPIDHVINTSKKIMAGDLSARCDINPSGEIGVLCKTIDQMAESIEQHQTQLQEQTRMQMLQSEKLASVGRLAAGVAHEINNPLTGVLTFAHFLKDKKSNDESDLKDINVIIQETTRVRDIIRGLLDFARQSPPNKAMINVNEIIQQLLILIKGQKEFRNIKIIEKYDNNLPQLLADKNQLQQVILNLLLNAGEAISGPGFITITTQLCKDNSPLVKGKDSLLISISDTGCGISEEDMDKIFDPFFTTKPVGKGTGLGLSVSYGIVQQHNGAIKCESKQGEGTTFKVFLPFNS